MKAKTQVKEESVSMMNTPTLYSDRDNPRGKTQEWGHSGRGHQLVT